MGREGNFSDSLQHDPIKMDAVFSRVGTFIQNLISKGIFAGRAARHERSIGTPY